MRGLLAGVVLLLASPALADDAAKAKAKAKLAVDVGTKLYNKKQYKKAAEKYQQAYDLDPVPTYLYAIAQSQRLGGDCAKALVTYRRYLDTKPAASDEAKARANIERCEQDTPTPPAPAPPPPPPPPPPAPVPVVVPPPEEPKLTVIDTRSEGRPWTRDYLGHAMVIGGLASVAVGATVFLQGQGAIEDHNSASTYGDFEAGRGDLDGAKLKQKIGVGAMIGGGVLLIGGLLHYKFSGGERTVTATVGGGSTGIALGGSF